MSAVEAAPRPALRRVSALDVASTLGLAEPTAQQRAVIESPLEPAIVIAGAGSGKTETMASRVLWLLANGHVQAHQVLGLTFTRKAASELLERIRDRVGALAAAGLAPGYDDFEPPAVSTYNAFAGVIYRDSAPLIGRESEAVVLGDAAAWQVARSVVLEATDPALGDLDQSVDALTDAVLRLAADLGEHLADPAAVRDTARRYLDHLDALPLGPKNAAYADAFASWTDPVRPLPVVVDLALAFAARKKSMGAVQYSDQVGLALEILDREPRLVDDVRDRYRVVLLDEFQDTSVVQTRLLARLFGGTTVMAVGDPHQSIYGWRGASASSLEGFADRFGTPGHAVRAFALSTSWRNGTGILNAANTLAAPLTAAGRVAVERLTAAPNASGLPVESAYPETIADEAGLVAAWFAHRLAEPTAKGEPPTAALLLRARATMPVFLRALRAADVPVHVLGVGGLLDAPEIADLVAALRVVHDASAGGELVRLLAGGRWRIGPADLVALHRLAGWLEQRDWRQQRLESDVLSVFRRSLAEGESASIVDALDFLARYPAHGMLAEFSDGGLARLRDAGRMFAQLRSRSGGDLADLIATTTQALDLDIEVLANETRGGTAYLRAFDDALAGYLQIAEGATLGGFLGWLTRADAREDLAPRSDPAEPGTVQVLTVHGSKGLEWDLVAVPRLVEKELPTPPKPAKGWLELGRMPWEFRGDADETPVLGWRGAGDRLEMRRAVETFQTEVLERHEREERRLAYVAVTRARHRLLLTGSWWSSQTQARRPSPFLTELADAGVIGPLPAATALLQNPAAEETATFVWPRDPLGARRVAVEAAAGAVRAADPAGGGDWAADIDALLAERDEMVGGRAAVALPARIAASRFKDYVDDPAAVAAHLRRPMPERPYRATRLGTRFHAWVEQRSGLVGSEELLDADLFDRDAEPADSTPGAADDARLAALQATFAASPWGTLSPIAVETEIQLPFAGQVVVCKIDAVYERNGHIEIVDWKTGVAPKSAADLELKQLQLALYRLAYAKHTGADPADVDAVFYYVAEDRIVRPDRIYSEDRLRALWSGVVTP